MSIRAALFTLVAAMPATAAMGVELGLPAACTLGKDCFVQQYPDMDAGPGAVDPFCNTASYEGHDGIDLRIMSMADVTRGVPVLAVADGKVLRLRDGVPDHLVVTDADRAAVADKECGNGMVLDLGDGIEAQYCHMRQGSLIVKSGDPVKKGEMLGDIGASGMAQFPHVHVTVRKDGRAIDPVSGHDLGSGCVADPTARRPLFSQDVISAMGDGDAQLVAFGLTDGPVDYNSLVVAGPPATATAASPNTVGWAWFINLHKDDRIRILVTDPSGAVVADELTPPMDRSKASYSAFAGKRGAPLKGDYSVTVAIDRDGKQVAERTGKTSIK